MYDNENVWNNTTHRNRTEYGGRSGNSGNYGNNNYRDNNRSRYWENRDEHRSEHRSERRNDFKKTLDIRSEAIGLIIGRAGSNIQRIQNDYNVHVDINKERKYVTVTGNVKSDVDSAINYIQKQLNGTSFTNREKKYDNYDLKYNQDNDNSYKPKSFKSNDNYSKNSFEDRFKSTDVTEKYEADKYGRRNPIKFTDTSNDDAEFKYETIDWGAMNKKAELEREKRWAKCPPLTKNFYNEAYEVKNLSQENIQRIRMENNETTVSRVFFDEKGDNTSSDISDIPNPIWKFDQCFSAYPDLMDEILKQKFEKPSPIQAQAWPVLLKGEDLIGIAQTGTGKTLAFLLPAMIHIEYQSVPRSERIGPNVLVLAPTRELALQIEKEVNKYSFRGIQAACIYGGGDRREQIETVKKGVEIIICTPGRLNDLIMSGIINVTSVTYLILDEADRMLDMGFEPQIRKILLDIRPDRQTIMTSATWPPGVRRLAQSYMNNPIQVCVGSLDLAATHTVKQIVDIMEDGDKFNSVKNFIKNMSPQDKVIIFCGKKVRADDLSSDLTLGGFMCQCIHGSRDQYDREQAIADITSGYVKILIATDVASRGLDIEDITHVINFDFPRNIEEYVHRVGRTGRAGRTGTSISFLTREDWALAKELIDILEEANQDIPDELRNMAERFQIKKKRNLEEMKKFNKNFRFGGGRGRNRI